MTGSDVGRSCAASTELLTIRASAWSALLRKRRGDPRRSPSKHQVHAYARGQKPVVCLSIEHIRQGHAQEQRMADWLYVLQRNA
jgi:hypothetical protein